MKRLVIVVLASILSMTVFAEGYQVNLLSTKQTGMGHVGTGMKLGAESMHFNPAGLVFLRTNINLERRYTLTPGSRFTIIWLPESA